MGSRYNKLFNTLQHSASCLQRSLTKLTKGMVSIYHSGKTLTIHQHMLSFLEVVFESSLQLVSLIRVTGLHQIINYGLTNNIELFENSFRRAGKDEIVTRFS